MNTTTHMNGGLRSRGIRLATNSEPALFLNWSALGNATVRPKGIASPQRWSGVGGILLGTAFGLSSGRPPLAHPEPPPLPPLQQREALQGPGRDQRAGRNPARG